jgi:hypothetical protein
MVFLPIVQGLTGTNEPTIRIELEAKKDRGLMTCCSNNHARQISHQKMVYRPPYSSSNKEDTGILSPENIGFIRRWLCTCCCSGLEQKRNIQARKQLVNYLSITYGDLPTKVAMSIVSQKTHINWDDPDQQKLPLTTETVSLLINETGNVSHQIQASNSYKQLMGEHMGPIPSDAIPRLETYTPERAYPQTVHSSEDAVLTVLREVGFKIMYRDPDNPNSPWLERPPIESIPSLEEMRVETQDENPSGERGSSIVKVCSISNTPASSPKKIAPTKEIIVRVPKSLAEAIIRTPQELDSRQCIEFYQAMLRNDVSIIPSVPTLDIALCESSTNAAAAVPWEEVSV